MVRLPRILIAEPLDFSAAAVAALKKVADVELRECDAAALRSAMMEFDVVWLRLAHRLDRSYFRQEMRCRIIAVPVTGLDHIDLEACAAHQVRVLSLRGEVEFLKEIRATAELTIGLTLSLLRQIPAAADSVRKGHWDRDRFRGTELFGKTVGLVGMGRLGSLVAGYFRAFGMRVLGYDPRPDFPGERAEPVASLAELLNQADLVSLHATYQPETQHLIDDNAFRQMKAEAILINTARGGLVQEWALLEALRSGRLAGAALDVVESEPRASAELLEYARNHDNLLIVPHIGGNTRESFAKTELFLANKVAAALHGG
ncbi:MAG TPA: NAD(P)-dependent oxidoreductase [Pirellulales bacterium]|jgi:D-3-phosphoglycerate dehydrogenase|nr:NAD(P)-dependent oxidoreductase [Pirellulales bacterium]